MAALHHNTRTGEFRLDKFRINKSGRDKWKDNRVAKKAKILGVTPEKIFEICFGWQHGQVEFAGYATDVNSKNKRAIIPQVVLEFCSTETICSQKNCNTIVNRKNGAFVRDAGGIISIYCSSACMGFE